MSTTSPLQALTIPVAGDAPDGPTQVTNLAKAAEQKLVLVFTSAAARTAAFTAAAISPAAGMLCYRSDAPGLNKFEYYNATAGAWRVHGAYQDSILTTTTTASITFSSVPTYLRSLRITVGARGDTVATNTQVQLRFGGDSSAAYGHQFHYVIQGGATGGATAGATAQTSGTAGYMPAASLTAGRFGAFEVLVTDWDNPAGHTTGCQWSMRGGYISGTTYLSMSGGVGEYTGSSALTSVTLFPLAGNFVAGCEFGLLGVE